MMPSRSVVLGLGLCLSVLGCEDEPAPTPPEAAEASAETKPALDDKIANAVAAAQASSQSASPSESQVSPPADGIMSPEAAARELEPGQPAQLILGSEGTAPRLRLGPERLTPGGGPAGNLRLSYRSGGSVMPTIEMELEPKVTALAPAAAAAASTAAAGSEDMPQSAVAIRFGMSNVRPAADQPGRLPENARSEIARLNGSWVELVSTPRGALQGERLHVAGGSGLESFVRGSAEALSSIVLPYPEAPVGTGAFWMVKSREKANGVDVLVYRMLKVTELNGQSAKLSVNTRRYLLAPSLPLQGLPPHRVRQFESQGNAQLVVRAGSLYPESAELEDSFAALLAPDERPGQAMPFRAELSARLGFPL